MSEVILEWVRSFEGVDETNCPSIKSMRDGIVFGLIFNQIQDEQVDFSGLKTLNPDKDDWITALRNIRAVNEKIKPTFEKTKVALKLDASVIAKGQNENAIHDLIKSFVLLALKGPKKADQLQKVKSCSKALQATVKEIITDHKQKTTTTAAPAKPAAPEPTPVSTTTKVAAILEDQIKKLMEQQSQLEKEKEELLKEKAEAEKNMKSPELLAYEKHMLEYDKLAEECKKLDEEVAAKEKQNIDEKIDEKRKSTLQEEALVKRNIQDLKQRIENMAPTMERFKASSDPKAQEYLRQIAEAEKRISQSYRAKLIADIEEFTKKSRLLEQDVQSLSEKVGYVEPGEDDGSEHLHIEVTELSMKTKKLEDEIRKINSKTEAIKALKQQKSFLEHLRSSSQFIKPQ